VAVLFFLEETMLDIQTPLFEGQDIRLLRKFDFVEEVRRLQSKGMTEASVCANSDNPAAIRLYKSVGFQKVKRLLTFRKGKTS